MTKKQFVKGWQNFLSRINFDHSALDADAIRFMNEMPAEVSAALLRDAEAAKTRKCRECGCTNLNPCPMGCHWIEADLCSVCDRKEPT